MVLIYRVCATADVHARCFCFYLCSFDSMYRYQHPYYWVKAHIVSCLDSILLCSFVWMSIETAILLFVSKSVLYGIVCVCGFLCGFSRYIYWLSGSFSPLPVYCGEQLPCRRFDVKLSLSHSHSRLTQHTMETKYVMSIHLYVYIESFFFVVLSLWHCNCDTLPTVSALFGCDVHDYAIDTVVIYSDYSN